MLLPLNQCEIPKVLPVQPEQIECVEVGLAAPKEQFVEEAVPVTVQAYDFSVGIVFLTGRLLSDWLRGLKRLKTLVRREMSWQAWSET